MTSYSLDPNKIQKMRSHSLQPSSWQFVGPLRSSFFGRDARWNLQLGSRFPNKRKKKKIAKTDGRSHRPRMRGISSSTVVTAKFEKSKEKLSAPFSIFQICFPETDCHAKTRLPDQRLWQSARPYLLIN